ncbi:tagatose 1,6-diphosphate aldolase GatY/KbaY [Entomoplasma freundtii]|uniref:Tagatose 1,6-diphosphate aldolase n=1 Tax=Entomoplasma freundtii TaxID=74700 RepID=A0A2K8NTY7_9MOLU|nr:class II fructose-bisphosphate aldolase [Entomoplasma freundtii]ATZ16221.1 tagatose 1,6-diphosphate aldolase [Entomoplasma freundtii]TDY56878.1 tagatose 1,6-diphosphate aldolase GatY/KbaY [Entomoplasma freundtii]
MKTSFKKELLKARELGYAVPAFNWDNLEMLKGIIEAAENLQAPVILMVTESAAKYMGVDYAIAQGLSAVSQAKVPVILHWDHGFDKNLIKYAIDAGFDSVMLDASQQPFHLNVAETQEIVAYARAKGVEVESEIGHVGGKEDDRNSNNGGYTDPHEARQFNNLTQVDALAIAVGTAHGLYKGKVNLQFHLIEEMAQTIDTPLVLHGSSDVPHEQLSQAIAKGIAKINIGTDLKVAYADAIKNWFQNNPDGFDARKFGRSGIDAVRTVAEAKIKAFNAAGKALE